MANISPPSKKKVIGKNKTTENIVEANATDQTPPNTVVPLQLKINGQLRNEFKAYAAINGKSMNKLFVEMYQEYLENHK